MSIDTFLLSSNTTDLNYPEVRPTLDLNFARVKALDPRITFTRSSGGSYYGADGLIKYAGVNEARFDHDPYTGESLGFLVEESRINYVAGTGGSALYAGYNFSAESIWTITAESTDVSAPDGSSLTTKAVSGSSGTTYFWRYTNILFAHSPNTTYTQSVWARVAVGTGSFSQTAYPFNAQQHDITTQWKRISVTYTTDSGPSEIPYMGVAFPSYNTTFYFWGWQIEQGGFPTSYIPTEGSSRTRTSDFASITGKNFRDFYNPTESSAFVDVIMKNSTGANGSIAYLFTNSSNYYYGFSRDSVSTYHFVTTSNINSFLYGTLSSNANYKACMAWKQNDINSYINSVQNFNTNSVTLFTPDILYLGVSDVNTNTLNGTIRKFTYYPKRLPNAQLITLTR